jgi:hypothetical protein
MPISKERMALYPGGSIHSKEWRAIREAVRARSGDCCEGSPNYPECRAVNGQPHPVTKSKVVLTVAHLDHDPSITDITRMLHLCQRCHLTYDAKIHAENAGITRHRKRGQPDLFKGAHT